MRDKIALIIGNREFESNFENGKDDVLFKALNQAFKEIDELKEQNKNLNDKLNSYRKIK